MNILMEGTGRTDMAALFQAVLRLLVTCAYPVALIFTMSRFRLRTRTVWRVYTVIILFGTFLTTVLLCLYGSERMKQLYALILFVPCVLFLLFATKDTPSQIFFNFFTAVNAAYLTSILSHFLMGGLNDESYMVWLDALLRAFFFTLIIIAFVRYLRRPYQFLAENMKKGSWMALAVVPFLFFCLVMFLGLYPHVRTDNLLGVFFLYIILGFVYYIIYQVFHSTYNLLCQEKDLSLLRTQVEALQQQTESVSKSERQLRVYRHDMRHYLSNVSGLLKNGHTEEALSVLSHYEALTEQTKLCQYCRNMTVNAILSLYLEKAKEKGIHVFCQCDIPQDIPIDSAELSTVFANAIENAIHACEKIAPGQERRIEIKCLMNNFQLLLEVANTYDGEILFDSRHLPVSRESGHGIGTQSIAAFAGKYNASLDYKEDTLFRLRILIPFPNV